VTGQDSAAQQNSLPYRDIPWLLSKIALQEIRRLPPHERVDQNLWTLLKRERPNLTDFMSSASYQLAPDDPDLRAEIASFGLSLVSLITAAGVPSRTMPIRPVLETLQLGGSPARSANAESGPNGAEAAPPAA
jgi:hypothetical protein